MPPGDLKKRGDKTYKIPRSVIIEQNDLREKNISAAFGKKQFEENSCHDKKLRHWKDGQNNFALTEQRNFYQARRFGVSVNSLPLSLSQTIEIS